MNEIDATKEKIYAVRYSIQSISAMKCSIFMTEKARNQFVDNICTYYAGVAFAETFEFVRDIKSFKTVKG